MPPCAISKRPGLSLIAPVKAPRSWPKSSVSIRVSEKSAQLTATKGWWRRVLSWCSTLAMTSLPVPLSPMMITLLSLRLTTLAKSKMARIRGLRPTTTSSRENWAWRAHAASSNDQELFELGDLAPQRPLDADWSVM